MPHTYTLIFDTETTGLPPKRDLALESQPWVLQLACILYRDEDWWPVGHFSTYLVPSHESMSGGFPESEFHTVNKLTPEFVLGSAMPLENGLKFFNHFLRRADRLVAHNMAFDEARMRDQYRRVLGGANPIFESVPRFCTMETLTPVMRLPAKFPGKFKWPNLDEAYRHMVSPAGFTNAHDAMADVMACASVLRAIETGGIPLHRCA